MKYIGSYENPDDIATKKRVDAAIASVSTEFVVNVTQDGGTLTADKTFNEIVAAISAKKTVTALFNEYVLYTTAYRADDYIAFCGVVDDGSVAMSLICGTDGTLVGYVNHIPNLTGILNDKIVKRDPETDRFIDAIPGTDYMAPVPVTAADNGKFLRVVDGAWAAATVPDANGVSF